MQSITTQLILGTVSADVATHFNTNAIPQQIIKIEGLNVKPSGNHQSAMLKPMPLLHVNGKTLHLSRDTKSIIFCGSFHLF